MCQLSHISVSQKCKLQQKVTFKSYKTGCLEGYEHLQIKLTDCDIALKKAPLTPGSEA